MSTIPSNTSFFCRDNEIITGWAALQLFKILWLFQKSFPDLGVRVQLLNISTTFTLVCSYINIKNKFSENWQILKILYLIRFLKCINIYRNGFGERIRAETIHERKDNKQQNIIIFQTKADITKIDNLIILFIMNIKRIDDYSLIHKI